MKSLYAIIGGRGRSSEPHLKLLRNTPAGAEGSTDGRACWLHHRYEIPDKIIINGFKDTLKDELHYQKMT